MGKLLFSSFVIGVVSGIVVTIYGLSSEFFKNLLFPTFNMPWWYFYLVPMVSILIVNILIMKNEKVKEYGVSEIAKAIEENRVAFSFKDLVLKIFASSLSISSGFAVGNEGPSAAIGAMVAQKVHNFFKLPKDLLRVSLGIGASSGIATIFVSPLTGVMFAIENLAYEFVKDFGIYLVVGGVVAFSIGWMFLDPLVFDYSIGKFLEYRYILAIIFFVPVISFFVYFYLGLRDRLLKFFNKFEFRYKNFLIAIIGGGVIGTIMLISPYAAFSGHEVVETLINDKFHLSLNLIFVIIVLRIVAVSVSLYANAVGGLFITLMSIGALIGYGFAEVLIGFGVNIEPFYFAAIGAAVFMGVNMKLPLTAVILALELTYDYNVVIPTAISVAVVSYLVSLNFKIRRGI